MKKIIIEHDYANADWAELINEAYREISSMNAAEIMAAFITRSRKILLSDEAFIAVVSGGKFYLEMYRGGLIWEFIFPEKKPTVSEFFHEITISWKEFVEQTGIIKEISIPYGDCGFSTFMNILRAEVPEELANNMASNVLDIISKMPDDVPSANRRQAFDFIESGAFDEKFTEFLMLRDTMNKYDYAWAIESALAHTLRQCSEPIRRLFASGTFVYDGYENEILFKVIGENFKETDGDFTLKVIIRENDELGFPLVSYEVQSTFGV